MESLIGHCPGFKLAASSVLPKQVTSSNGSSRRPRSLVHFARSMSEAFCLRKGLSKWAGAVQAKKVALKAKAQAEERERLQQEMQATAERMAVAVAVGPQLKGAWLKRMPMHTEPERCMLYKELQAVHAARSAQPAPDLALARGA